MNIAIKHIKVMTKNFTIEVASYKNICIAQLRATMQRTPLLTQSSVWWGVEAGCPVVTHGLTALHCCGPTQHHPPCPSYV